MCLIKLQPYCGRKLLVFAFLFGIRCFKTVNVLPDFKVDAKMKLTVLDKVGLPPRFFSQETVTRRTPVVPRIFHSTNSDSQRHGRNCACFLQLLRVSWLTKFPPEAFYSCLQIIGCEKDIAQKYIKRKRFLPEESEEPEPMSSRVTSTWCLRLQVGPQLQWWKSQALILRRLIQPALIH